jgi:hypothetical protein
MVKVEGQNLEVLRLGSRLRHHAQLLLPLIDALVNALIFDSSLARDSHVHVLRQVRTGAGSFMLKLADGREFHFRPASFAPPAIRVLDSYHHGSEVVVLKTRNQCQAFMRGLRMAPAKKAA